MSKERRLGRGLEALLGRPLLAEDEAQPAPAVAVAPVAAPAAPSSTAPIDQIDRNPYQPRRQFDEDEVRALSDSIATHGLLQPLVVRRIAGRYQLIAGERRLRATLQLGWRDVPVHIVEADDRQVAEVAIVENLQRKDLNPLEKAAAFQEYLARYGCSQDELAGRIGADRSTVANLIRLLELPESVQDALRTGGITAGHARALLPLGDETEQQAACAKIQSEGLSVRQTEELVRTAIDAEDEEPLAGSIGPRDGKVKKSKSAQVAALETEFRRAIGSKVDVRKGTKESGRIVIHFKSHDEFDRIREFLCGTSTDVRKAS